MLWEVDEKVKRRKAESRESEEKGKAKGRRIVKMERGGKEGFLKRVRGEVEDRGGWRRNLLTFMRRHSTE